MDSSSHERSAGGAAVELERPARLTAAADDGPELLADHLLEALSAATRRVRTEMRRNSGLELTVPQFRALRYVERHPGTDLSSLAAHLGMSPSSASTLVERLTRSGQVERTTDPAERRRIRIVLSPAGAAAVERAVGRTRVWLSQELGAMTADDRRRLGAALDVLGRLGAAAGAAAGSVAPMTHPVTQAAPRRDGDGAR
jgi:DNA-binding MarR family transcriptional regulator